MSQKMLGQLSWGGKRCCLPRGHCVSYCKNAPDESRWGSTFEPEGRPLPIISPSLTSSHYLKSPWTNCQPFRFPRNEGLLCVSAKLRQRKTPPSKANMRGWCWQRHTPAHTCTRTCTHTPGVHLTNRWKVETAWASDEYAGWPPREWPCQQCITKTKKCQSPERSGWLCNFVTAFKNQKAQH